MITDLEADKLADEYPNASPERKPQIETALRTWVTAAEAEAADRAREGAARLRQSFKSVSDLGGLWTKEQELRLPPTDNPDEVKARVANTAFLAEAGGMDYETAAKTYEGLRARWAQATLGKKDAGDLEMYAEVSRQYQDGEDKAKLAFQRDADAASRGFQRALEGAPPDWSTPESEWRKGAEKAPGFDANWGFGLEQSVAYRDAFQRAFKVATEHRPLVLETLDTLKRGTKWINQGAGLSEEAASRLMELPDAERADVLRAIVAGAASMSPEDPGAAVSNLQKVFKNMGISASRGLDALRLSKVSQALSAADAASALEAIKDGKPVYDLGGGKIATSLAAVQGAFGLEVSMQAAEPVPASEIPALTKKLEGTLKFFQITNQLEQVSRQYLDPIRPAYKTGPGWVAETMAVGLAGSAPQMVAGAIPGVGLPWMTASFVDSAYERIVADQPDIDPRSALAMATVAGTIEGGIEMLQIRNAVGLLPATSKLVQAIRTPNVNLFKVLGIQVGANIAEQNLEEALQDLALPTVKAIGAALNKDIEGVNWAQEWQEFGGTRLETFLSVLPLAILGAGAAGIRETTAFRNLLASEQALVEYGLPREVAASIAAQETPEARQAVFFEEQSKRTPESIRAGIAEAEARVARETVAATSNETPTMVYEGGKFRIVEPDGSSSMAFDDAETASLALQSRNQWEESGAAVAVRELADWLGMRDSDKRKWEVVPKIVTLEDDKLATPEQIAERMQLAGLEGLAPSEAQVFGQNVTEVRDGVVRVVNSVFIDSDPFDVIEEEVHFRFRQERDAGIITREEAEAAVRSFQGEKAPQTFSEQALEEAVAEMGKAYFGGNFRFIQNMPQSVRSFFLRMAKFFRETFRNAAKLKRLIREGKIDANWVEFLNRSVGLTEAVQEQEAALKAAQEIAGQTSVTTTAPAFSLGTTPAEVIEPPAVAELQGLQTVEVPVDQLKLSADVPQFKRGAIGGIVKPLEGKFDKTGVGPIQVWRRLNGDLEVISGRHRWDLAKRSGIATIPAQVHEESQGFTAKQAATLDAELNIRDEQGSVADFAVFFRNSELTEEEAKAKGYLQRVKGQQGWTIGKNASEDVFAAHQAARINDAAAAAVAASAPNDSSLQAVGLKAVLEGKNADFAGNLVKAYAGRVEQKKSEGADFGDLFSFDDSAIKEAEQEAALVSKIQKDIREDIRSVRDAARFPQRAKKFGVNVNKPETVLAAVTQLESELMKWEGSWFMDPELKSKLKQMKETGQIIREPQVRFSVGARQVSETDRKYLDAVNRGDMETAQKMVDEAAKAAGFKVLYHGTTASNKAAIERSGILRPDAEPAVYLTTDPSGAGYGDGSVIRIAVPESKIEIDDEFPDGREDYRAEVGYKGSLRIKSADPVTRDDAGNIILPSQRFNPETPDIRFSVGKKKKPKEETAIDERHLNLAPAEYIGGRGTVSTRVPTAKKAVESEEVLHINLEAINQSEELKAKLAQNLRDGVQEGGRSVKYLTDEQAAGTDDEVIRHFIDLVKSNLLWLWDKFPEEYKERAKLWYVGANKIAEACAEFYGVTVEQAAGVLAVESPQKDWFQNVSMAERIMRIWKRAMKEDFVFTQERFDYCYNNDVEEVKAVAESEFNPRIFKPKKWSKRSGVSEEEFNASEEQRKKDHRKKERERKSAFLEKREKARLKFQEKNLKWEFMRPRMVGKPWSQLDYDGKARLFRALDEMEGDRSYRIILPEGGRGEIARTSKGEPAVVAWSSYNFIAKAFSILDDGSLENISRNLGEEHKVRNFFNNISDPHNTKGYVTIDTHAIAAALLNSLSGTSNEVKDNFGAAGGDAFVGVGGTYGIYATAYKELADELSRLLGRQVLAREVQSVTWEAVRLLFTKEQKTSGKLTQQLDALWNEHAEGKAGIDDVRRRIWDLSGGIQPPSWANTEFGFDAQQSGVAGSVFDGGPFIPLGRRAGGADTSMDPREGSIQREGIVRGSNPVARFSVGRKAAPYAEQLAAQMDALKTKPAVRIQIYERAKKKFRELVERNRAAIAEAQAADTRKPAEIIEEAKATHDAEVARIDAERDAALAAAATDKQRNTARLVHGTKLRAANMALSKALAAATGEGTRQARTAQVVGELNAILSAFPAEVRGRVGGFVQLASLKTETGRANELSRRLAKAETELEKLLRKEYRAQLDRVLDSYRPQREAGKKPKGKIGAQAQEILDAAEAAMIMDATEVAALVAKYDLLANDPDATKEDATKNGTIRDILPLLGDIKNADSARLVSAIDAVKFVGSEGWARWKFQQLQLREDRRIATSGLVQDSGKTGVRAERAEAEKNAASVAGKSLAALLNLSSFSQAVDYFFGAESKFGAEFKKREMEASNQLEDKMDALNTAISDLFTEMAGGVVDGERLHYKLSQRSIKTDQGEFSELEALTAILMWMQEDGKRHMIGKLDEAGQPVGAWHYNQDFVDGLAKAISREAVKVMDWLRKQYDAEHAELNPLYQKRHGVSLPKHENYSPISANPQQTKLGQTVDPVSGSPVSGSILTPGSLRSRSLTAVAEPNFRDALKVFLAHKRSMEHWAAYYDLAVDAQAILAHRDVTNAVEAKAGPEGKTVLTGWLNYFAQGGIREAAASLSINKLLSRMLGRASVMALFGRASTIMVQSTQLGASSAKMPLGAYVLRLSKLMSGQLGWGDAIKSEFIQRRLKQAPAIVQQAMQALGDAGKPNLIKHAARQVGKLISGADALFTAGTYAILLDFHKGNAAELNLTGPEADRFAHEQAAQDTEAVAQPTRAANRSLAELTATHPMARLGWAFGSEARQKISLTAWAFQKRNSAQISKTMFLTFVVGGLFTQILKNLWREMKGDDDEEKWSAKRLAIASFTGPLNGIPGFSALTGDGGTLLSKLQQSERELESLLDGDQSAAQVVQGMNTLLSAMGLFSDNAAALSVMGNVATDAAKLLQNVSGEKTSSK